MKKCVTRARMVSRRPTGYTLDMVERLTVVFFIILCVLLGCYLILAPWDALFGPWGENALLVYLSDKTGAPIVQQAVASTWFRGAVTGLGVLNILIAIWELTHFRQSVDLLTGGTRSNNNAADR
ncbi:MAG: hypothetical protein KBD94_04230 [Pyrinomonadaceae bacterium]|nr:hypothetical protein [Pyrinomonadaceae bacterium]